MSHDHSHHDDQHPHDHIQSGGSTRRLGIVLVMILAFMVVEAVGGWLTNSLALIADAGHMLTDAGAIALALFASWLARRPSGPQRTYGYYRAEILAALMNAVTLIAIVVFILMEAYERLSSPQSVMGLPMMLIAIIGLIVNLVSLRVLHANGSQEHDGNDHALNVRGVIWHIIGDTLGSVGAITGGLLVWWKGWYWADPVVSVVISVIILFGGVKLVLESVSVLMESSPERIDVSEVQTALCALNGVSEVHDLHIWTVTSGFESLSVHLVTEEKQTDVALLSCAREVLESRFGLDHVTIQIEPPGFEHAECDAADTHSA
jgi:cobalt-zinc-cadmium efflux system protein